MLRRPLQSLDARIANLTEGLVLLNSLRVTGAAASLLIYCMFSAIWQSFSCLFTYQDLCIAQGTFLDFLRHIPFIFDRTQFHDALHDFLEGQKMRLEQAVSQAEISHSLMAVLDLQALSLILVTRFVLYKQALANIILQERPKKSWKRLVDLQESMIDQQLCEQGQHFAVLEVFPSMLPRDSDIHLPSLEQITHAKRKKAKQYHSDRQYTPEGKRVRINQGMAEEMMRKITAASEFLEKEVNLRGFAARIQSLFPEKLLGLNTQMHSLAEKLLEEQQYGKLKMILQDIRMVDRRLAVKMRLSVEELGKHIKDSLIGEVRKTKADLDHHWNAGRFRELHEELTKLQLISKELAAYPEIIPDDLIKGISEKVDQKVMTEGERARRVIGRCFRIEDAMMNIGQFGGHLMSLGHIFAHLLHFKSAAQQQLNYALSQCYDKKWGVNFLFKLGMRLEQGDMGDGETDTTIAKILLNSFPHFNHVRTVKFNRETSITQKAVTETLRAAWLGLKCFWKVGLSGRRHEAYAGASIGSGWKPLEVLEEHCRLRLLTTVLGEGCGSKPVWFMSPQNFLEG